MRPILVLVLLAHTVCALPTAGQAPTAAGKAQPELVVSSGFVESKRISSGDPFLIWISFENRSGQEVRGLRFVDFRTGGLIQTGSCWSPVDAKAPERSRFPACVLDSDQPEKASQLPDFLAPGQAVTVTASLERGTRLGEFMMTGVYTWTGADGRARRALIPIGPVEVTTHWNNIKARAGEDFPLFLKDIGIPVAKDLALPIAAFILGLLIRSGEQKRSAMQQTWNQMLPKIHDYTATYYLPVSASATELIDTTRQVLALKDSGMDPDKPFYYLALLFRQMRTTVHETGGFYLKDRIGENLVVGSWAAIFEEFVASFADGAGTHHKDVLVDSIGDKEMFTEYKRKLSPSQLDFPARAELAKVRRGFQDWMATDDFRNLILPLLGVFSTAIDYEINRPYDTWYSEPYAFDAEAILLEERKLGRWLREARRRGVAPLRIERVEPIWKELGGYRRRNAGRTWPRGTRWVVRRWYDLRALKRAPA